MKYLAWLARVASLFILIPPFALPVRAHCARGSVRSAAASSSGATVIALQASPTSSTPPKTPVVTVPDSERSPQPAATEQYTLSEDRYEKAVAYNRAGYTLYFVSYFVTIAAIFLLLRLGIAAKFRDFAEGLTGRRPLQALLIVPLLLITVDLCDLPVRIYWHSLSLRYEQSVQPWGSWIWDWSKEELISMGLAIVFALILFTAIRRSPRHWWLYFWFAALPIFLGFIFVVPWVIDPLFHKFEPLAQEHPELVQSIEKLTQTAGVPVPHERIFLMRASEKSNEINAYVTGLGASKRVVIWDTTLQKTSSDETLFIVGHELGHYVLGHVWKGFVYGALGLLAALYLIFRGMHWALDRWAADWKLYGLEDWASLALFLLLLQMAMFFAAPAVNGITRMQEHAADVYGLELIHGVIPNSEEVAAHSFQILGEVDLSDPNPSPFITFWLYSHPPLGDRLVFAHTYDPWSKGESPKYVKARHP